MTQEAYARKLKEEKIETSGMILVHPESLRAGYVEDREVFVDGARVIYRSCTMT
jgi:hypothetical protein